MSKEIPDYVEGHNLLAGKSVLITALLALGLASLPLSARSKRVRGPLSSVTSTRGA